MIVERPEAIIIPENRYRRNFDRKALDELKQSILRNGLLHAPVVEVSIMGSTLRAGERRYKVLCEIIAEQGSFIYDRQVFTENIPCMQLQELDELQRLEVEVEENVVRRDFDWKERTAAITALHALRVKMNPQQTVTATATEVQGKPAAGSQITEVTNALLISKHMSIPEVANAKDAKAALKAIEKIKTAGHRANLAVAAAALKSDHILIKGDSYEILPTLPEKSFDVIITDPPYGVDADKFGTMAATGHDYADSKAGFERLLKELPDHLARVAKERAHAYIFCDIRWFSDLSTHMLLAGWTVFPTPLIWSKGNGMLPHPDHGPRRTYESILYAWRGDRRILVVKGDVIDIPSVKGQEHGAQKPVALYKELLSRSANPGDSVLDCFGGTGPILIAANLLKLRATYIERGDNSFNIAQLRKDVREIDDGAAPIDGLEDIKFD